MLPPQTCKAHRRSALAGNVERDILLLDGNVNAILFGFAKFFPCALWAITFQMLEVLRMNGGKEAVLHTT